MNLLTELIGNIVLFLEGSEENGEEKVFFASLDDLTGKFVPFSVLASDI